MISQRDALHFLDLDKGASQSEEALRRIRGDANLRRAWIQFQALRALAIESAPEPSEKMFRELLEECRREQVGRQLSRLAGDEAAHEILSGSGTRGGAGWFGAFALLVALGLAWAAFHFNVGSNGSEATQTPVQTGAPAALFGVPAAVPFEFPVQTPPIAAALSGPGDDQTPSDVDADDVHSESPVERQASRLLREHLHEAEARNRDGGAPHAASASVTTLVVPSPSAAATAEKAVAPPKHSSAAKKPKAGERKSPEPAPVPASLALSSDHLWAAAALSPSAGTPATLGPLDIALGMPEQASVDVRLFSPTGKSARVLASGVFGPGTVHFSLEAKDDHDRTLAPGTYYLRVMTPWFSRVEPIQIH